MVTIEHIDVLIIGAGISGISAAYHVQTNCPGKDYAILESRAALGGTWDLFKYPGVRSDSDMHTLGFRFKPWTAANAIADAPSILDYLNETADQYGLNKHIRLGQRLISAAWDSSTARWTVNIADVDGPTQMTCNFLFMCTGYYAYDEAYRPYFDNEEAFAGPIIHPQFWPETLDYQGKNIVVIGSGATAVTIVPALAQTGAGHVTMLQRSPSYFASRPAQDRIANWMRKLLPEHFAFSVTRWKNILLQSYFYWLTQRKPAMVKAKMIDLVQKDLGADYDVATHFTPRYFPWEQRLCLVPDNDFFESLKSGKASVVTGMIRHFDKNMIILEDGQSVSADIIVSATGLKMEVMSGVTLTVNGRDIRLCDTISYKGFMYGNVPNLASTFGYSNASWTLKADLISEYVCRLINHMDKNDAQIAVPNAQGVLESDDRMMNLTSGYVTRAAPGLPKQGADDPWRVHHNYLRDIGLYRRGKLEDGAMEFRKANAVVSV